MLVDPNSAEITRYHDPYDIDDPFTYRAKQGFIGINLWTQDNSGTVYLQGHLVIPGDWGNVSTNGDTTTTTDDTTEKDGGVTVSPDDWVVIVNGGKYIIAGGVGFYCSDMKDGKLPDDVKDFLNAQSISESRVSDIEKKPENVVHQRKIHLQ